ncbi:response regulator [Sporobolomyces salmoneus]|uniref:response regulator n=1 Tax=Sporobolomyces salmoneus TaxID=183962 RepID=UPI00317B1E81
MVSSSSPPSSSSSSPSFLQPPAGKSPRRRPSLVSASTGPELEGESLTDSAGMGDTREDQSPRGSSASVKSDRIRKNSNSRRVSTETSSSNNSSSSQSGTFLTRFLGSFRPPPTAPQNRPPLPRSLSSPIKLARDLMPSSSSSSSSISASQTPPPLSEMPPPVPQRSAAVDSQMYQSTSASQSSTSLSKRFRSDFTKSRSQRSASPPVSPSASPMISPALSNDVPRMSPGSPATLRGKERDPMETALIGGENFGGTGEGSAASTPRAEGRGISRRESVLSQRTLLAHDRNSTAGSLSGGVPLGSPLRPIEEPQVFPPQTPHLDQSLQLIATLLPPALLLLSQLGPAHLFSPPLKIPSLFEVALGGSSSRKSSVSGASNSFNKSEHIQSDRASIASTATADTTTTSTSFLAGLPSIDHLRPSHSHELHAPSSLSVPAVSAAAIWRLFRGFEWIGEVGKGEQPPPPSPTTADRPPVGEDEDEEYVEQPEDDEYEQIFDFPSMLQGVSDVLAADTAARGIELVIGQVGNGSAPSPAATPTVDEKKEGPIGERPNPVAKDIESRELLVRADERAWSVALVWILHHIIAGANSGSTIEVRFLATAASVAPENSTSQPAAPSTSPRSETNVRPPQKWWTVSLEILHSVATSTPAHPYPDPSSPGSGLGAELPSPPFDSLFAKDLFSLVGFELGSVEPGTLAESASKSWVLESLLPAARPKPRPVDDPSTLLGRRRASLEASIGQEPSIGDLKRFADSALKGHRVALHASDQSTFAKHLTMYLAGWGMDVQHVPLDAEGPLSSGSSVHGLDGKRPSAGSRFDSGFAGTDSGTPPGFASPNSDGSHKSPDLGANGEPNSNLCIIDDDVSTLRRLLVALRAPPLHAPPTLISKRPQLATRRARSSPHVRQLHQLQQQGPSQWVIVHFASLTHYKTIKEIVADALATTRSPSLPEVLVIPKPAGPRRIITSLWTALKRPAVDPFLPPIATSPTSPGIQYWTPRLSPALAKEQEFDFGGSDSSGSKNGESNNPMSTLGKPRTPPTYFSPSSTVFPPSSHLPPSPLGQNNESQDSYFSSVAEELKEATPSEGMVIQSPDGRSGIFFQPQTRSQRSIHAKEKAASKPMERDRQPAAGLRDQGANEFSSDPSSGPARVSTATPHEIGLGPSSSRRKSSNSSVVHADQTAPPMPLGTPALHLDSFISAAKSRANGEDVSPEELPPPTEELARHASSGSNGKRPNAAARHSNSSGGSGPGSTAQSPLATSANASPNFGPPSRRPTIGAPSPMSNLPPSTPLGPAAQGAAAARASGSKVPPSPSSPRTAFGRSRTGTVTQAPKGKRRASRKNTLPSVPPIRVLIVEDNKINQTILSVFMKKRGIKCEVAVDGAQAVDKWKKGNFHLVLMDIQLPVKDGIEATREIRELERANNVGTFITTPTTDLSSPSMSSISNPLSNPGSPLLHMPVIIVALTASSLQADRVNALAAGCNDFLTKPVSLPWLETKLVEWGSMAYLSGFGRKMDSPEPTTSTTNLGAPPAPQTQGSAAKNFSAGINSKADEVRGHLHIDRAHKSDESPGSSSNASPALDAGPPVNTVNDTPAQPSLMLTSPTPQETPKTATTAAKPEVNDKAPDPTHVLDKVEEKLEDLVQEQEDLTASPKRPGPTPLPPSVLGSQDPSLHDVLVEGDRLAELGRTRAGSASFGQALTESGVSSARGSNENLYK